MQMSVHGNVYSPMEYNLPKYNYNWLHVEFSIGKTALLRVKL